MMNPNDYKLTGTYYLDVTDMEKHEGKHPNYDYSKNGKCDKHGAFNNHYRRNCPKCVNDEEQFPDTSDYCNTCAGTGEGMHDGTRCIVCKGSGTIKPVDDEDGY